MYNGINAILTIFNSNLSDAIKERIDYESQFTTVTETDPKDINSLSLSLLCLNPLRLFDNEKYPQITHICILKKGQRVSTNQVRIKGIDVISLPEIKLEELFIKMPSKFSKMAERYFSGGYEKVPPRTGNEILKSLLKVCPEQRDEIERLAKKVSGYSFTKNFVRKDTAAFEKDALAICLDIFGADRNTILNEWNSKVGINENSFLNGLTNYRIYEDDIINYDLNNLPGWNKIYASIAGIVEFVNDKNETLLVINANRKPLEKALGVDLIYFHKKFNAFTFVQYKMMNRHSSKNNKEFYYNPNNKIHNEELERMNRLQRFIDSLPAGGSLNDYRIGTSPIYFKLCKNISFKENDTSIAKGAYIPINQWNILIKDKSTKGTKGGCQIGYHTLDGRYIRTATFIELVKQGFLGTQSPSSMKISGIVEELILKGHSVIYAIDSKGSSIPF